MPTRTRVTKIDPSRTALLRRRFMAEMNKRFIRLKGKINALIVDEDAIGLLRRNAGPIVDNAREFSSTQVDVMQPNVLAGLARLKAMIDPDDVLKAETEPHITVRFGLHDSAPDRAALIVAQHPPIKAILEQTVSLFRSDENDVLKIDVRPGSGLESLNAHLGILPNTQTHPDYHPHLTIAYLKPGTGDKYVGISWPEEIELVFDHVTFSSVTRERTSLPLLGSEPIYNFDPNQPRLVSNTRWRFLTSTQKLEAFKQWLQQVLFADFFSDSPSDLGESWLQRYVTLAFRKGVERAFSDTRPQRGEKLDWYRGTRDEFLRSAFSRPVSVGRVKLLASRAFNDLKGITEAMSQQISRELVDGMIQGQSPREVARAINNRVDKIGRTRALTLARTETIAAHAEGQLTALEQLGVKEVGVAVEWSTAEDELVCPLCKPLEGIVIKIEEAHGLIPRHPSCRCAFVPANVGEATEGQKRTRERIKAAIDRSVRKERKRGTLEQAKKRSRWVGAGRKISKRRPRSIITNYDPNQPRDEQGQWAADYGGSYGGAVADGPIASKRAMEAALKAAKRKIRLAPVPSRDEVQKARRELEAAKQGLARAGGESRGGSAADRRRQRERLFNEFGGAERGYVVCPWTGIKMHWSSNVADNPEEYPTFERGKIFTKWQGGGYQLPNLIPESFTANRARGSKRLRRENT